MTKVCTNNDVYNDGKILQLKYYLLGHACSARSPGSLTLADANFCLNITPVTQEDVDDIMAQINYMYVVSLHLMHPLII